MVASRRIPLFSWLSNAANVLEILICKKVKIDNKIYEKLDRGSIGSTPKYGIGAPPKKNKEFQNDPTLGKGWGLRTCRTPLQHS